MGFYCYFFHFFLNLFIYVPLFYLTGRDYINANLYKFRKEKVKYNKNQIFKLLCTLKIKSMIQSSFVVVVIVMSIIYI
jgi:hypothetical protein